MRGRTITRVRDRRRRRGDLLLSLVAPLFAKVGGHARTREPHMTTPTIEPAAGRWSCPEATRRRGRASTSRSRDARSRARSSRRCSAGATPSRCAGSAGGGWESWTWAEYADRVARVCTGLRELGVERGQRVLIMMRNRPEFHVVDMATMMIGATPFSVYTSSPTEQLRYVAMHSGATVAVVESPGLAERFLTIREELAGLRHLVIVDDPDEVAPADVVQLARLLARPRSSWSRRPARPGPRTSPRSSTPRERPDRPRER